MQFFLPLDIASEIIRFSVWMPIVCARTGRIELTKQRFHKGISEACTAYHEIYMSEWLRHMTLHDATDWKTAVQYGFADSVRTLVLKESALLSHSLVKAHLNLSKFGLIHTLILNCHNDVGCNKSSGTQGQWSYRRILPNFPQHLKSLVVLDAHGPDLQVIQRAIEQCSGLEHLSLGRCTKFNRPNSCDFWKQFPDDHDSYFSVKGTNGYADALGNELRALTKLESLYVNVYLTDTKYLSHPSRGGAMEDSPTPPPHDNSALTDLTTPISPTTTEALGAIELDAGENEERPGASSVPENEQSQLDSTESQDKKATKEAEKEAAEILFGCHPNLRTAGFISFWSQGHLGWSLQEREAREYVYTSAHKAPDPGEESPGHNPSEATNERLTHLLGYNIACIGASSVMSDFADLWNSVTPNSNATKKPAGKETLASQLNASRNNGLGTTSQPISRVPTPSYFSSQGISPQLSGQAQRTGPRPGSTGPAAKSGASSNPGDAFGDLLSLSGSSQSKNMTIAERQALASKEQAKAEEQKRKEREAHGAFWDQLEFSSSTGSTPRTNQNATGLLAVSPPPFVPRIETTLTPSRAVPLPSSKPNTSAVAPASHTDVWDLDSFLAPNKPTSRAPTPSSATSPGPKREQTNASLFDLLDSSPSGNQLAPDTSPKDTPARTGTPGDFDWGNREDDEDDLLGDLGKPVSQRPSKPPTPTPPNDLSASGSREPIRMTRQGSPPPHIIGQIVEMGFSVKEAKRALANTATGTDVQAALDSLLAGGTTSGTADHEISANDLERFREEDEAARWEHEEAERRRRRRAGPSRSPAPEPAGDDTARQLQEKADQLLAQASVFGTSVFNRANALWREGKDKAMKAYEERTAGSTSANSGRSRDTGRPAWMQDEPSPPTERRNIDMPEHSGFRDDDDSALPPHAAPRPSRPAAPRQPSQPTIVTTAPVRPADKIASLFSDTPAYVSPARRKAPSQSSTPVQPSPAVERIAPAPVVLRTRPNPPVSADTLSAVQSHRMKGTEAFKLGQYGAAADSYTTALQLLPEGHLFRIPLLNNRAAARSKTGDASGAIDDCTLVLDVIGDDFDPAKETPIPDVDLSGALVKALRRRAETLESTEKWKRAREDWERLAKAGGAWAGGKTSSEGVQGVGRCKRMEEGGDSSVPKPRAPVASTKPKPKPRPVPSKATTSKPNSAVHRLKTANAAAEAEGDQKHALKDTVDARIMAWKGGMFESLLRKENNIRALIASLDTVLWPELGWVKVGMHELVMPNQVKVKYVRAIAKVHPDKLNASSTTVEQRMIANSVFGALNEAWNAFDQ